MPTETQALGTRQQALGKTPAVSGAESDSALTVSLAADTDRAAWDAYVATNAEAVGYHEWAWHDVFARSFGHHAIYLIRDDVVNLTAGGNLTLAGTGNVVLGDATTGRNTP